MATDNQEVLIQPAVDVTGRSVAEPIGRAPIQSILAVTVALAAHVLPVVALVAHVLPVVVLVADTLLAVAVATLVEVEGKE